MAIESQKPYGKAKIDFRPHSFEDALQLASTDFGQRSGQYDIVLQYNFSLSSYARHHWVYTVDDLKRLAPRANFAEIERDLFRNVWEEVGFYYSDPVKTQGELAIGYPFAANTMLLVTNRRMFEDAENMSVFKKQTQRELRHPQNWPEFADLARFFTNKAKGTSGVCLQGAEGGWLYYEWANFLFGMGGTFMSKRRGWEGDSSTNIELDAPDGVKAANLYVSLKPYNSGDFFATGAAEQREEMLKDRTAMAIMWSDYLFDFFERAKGKGLNFEVSPVPGDLSMIAGGAFYINRQTSHPQEAAEYVLDLLGHEKQVALMRRGLCSPVRSAYEDDSIRATIPYAQALYASLKRGVYMVEAGPESDAVQAVVTEYLQKIWRGEGEAAALLRQARLQIEQRRKAIWETVRTGN